MRPRQMFSHELNKRVHMRIPGDIVTMMAMHGWNAFGIYEVVVEEMRREKDEKKQQKCNALKRGETQAIPGLEPFTGHRSFEPASL